MKKTITVIILIFCLSFLSSAAFAQDLSKIAEANFSAAKGEALYNAGRYNEAVSPLEEAIKIRPEHGRAHYNLVLVYVKLGNKEKAISLLSSYLESVSQTKEWIGSMDKEYIAKCDKLLGELKGEAGSSQVLQSEEHFTKAEEYYQKDMLNEAMVEINRSIEITPTYALAYSLRGVIYEDDGDYDKALADFNKAIEIDSTSAEFYAARGLTYYHKGDFDKAISDYDKAIEINPKDAEFYYSRGLAYNSKNNLDQAISDYSEAIEINPNYANAYNNRAFSYDKKGNYDQALSDCNKAIELDPNDAAAYDTRANIYFYKGEYDKSWEDVHKVESLGKGDKIDREFIDSLKKASGRDK